MMARIRSQEHGSKARGMTKAAPLLAHRTVEDDCSLDAPSRPRLRHCPLALLLIGAAISILTWAEGVWAQESVAVRAALVESVPTDDPMAAAWTKASMAEFPL